MNENGRKDGSEQSFLFSQSIDTQQGLLTVQASNKGVTAIAFAERLEASQPAHAKSTATAIEPNQVTSSEITKNAITEDACTQLKAYFAKKLNTFDLPLDVNGTEFQMSVWKALKEIPYGQTVSYLDIAKTIGNPKAVRAVGLANGKNPIAIVVPCHRVIGSNNTLTGYAGGLARKQFLLNLEGAQGRLWE